MAERTYNDPIRVGIEEDDAPPIVRPRPAPSPTETEQEAVIRLLCKLRMEDIAWTVQRRLLYRDECNAAAASAEPTPPESRRQRYMRTGSFGTPPALEATHEQSDTTHPR